ncbi:ornithine cyclodeaminase family protein [Rhodoplanes sp. Z2-YC6860]|uniref:ornithine cyclodeaminase family protein n=1 Tax=Rhodoplanes sp. Z2-YC6860 TaxID=674703 RepID=UPI0018DB339C|nr:ornithine cyclodeaminase family protein [Rhodoplanes sp. Z2-YC6860]
MSHPDVLFVSYQDTLKLLSVEDAMRVCEDVYRMHARGSVVLSKPPSFKLDIEEGFHNHWHVKGTLLKDIPVTGVRMYNYYNDGHRNTVGGLDCTRWIALSDPMTGHALAIVDEHLVYGLRSAAAAVIPCKWLGPVSPKVLGLVGIGSMGTNAMRCLLTQYKFEQILVTSRRPESREAFAAEWSKTLGIPVVPKERIEDVVRAADIAVGGTTSSEVMTREAWLKPGAVFISLARREFEPEGWVKVDKVVIDSWEMNYLMPFFKQMVDVGTFTRDKLHGEIHEVVAGTKSGRERADERILIHTTGLVTQDVAICHYLYQQAKGKGLGITLPAARAPV